MSLLDPFQYQFFVNGFIAAAIIGALTGLIGVFVILRKMSYIGHGLSHSVFGGAVLTYILGWNFYLGAGIWGFLSALLIFAIGRSKKIGADAAIGIVTTASFALGVAIISRVRNFTRNFEAALFGNILGTTESDVIIILAIALVVGMIIFFFYRPLLFTSFDPETAHVFGVREQRYEILFALILAITIIASIQILGVTLIAATLVIPASIARISTDSFGKMLVISTIIGSICGITGMYLSYYLDIASGAAIVLTATVFFALASYLFSGNQKPTVNEHIH